MEVWKVTTEFKELEVSNLGNVRYVDSKELLNIRTSKNAAYISFRPNGDQESKYVKIMVARAFLPESNYKQVICIDGNKLNCAATNLRYRTTKEPYVLKTIPREKDQPWIDRLKQLDRKEITLEEFNNLNRKL